MEPIRKRTPRDTTDFEREQLRFFLNRENVAETLAELNPSLAWLPEFAGMIQSASQLTPWIERNFDDPEAIREVSANLKAFDDRAAEQLEFRLNRSRDSLSPVLTKSWQLILRHIRNTPRGALRSEWFDVQPRIKRGEQSLELLERLAHLLRPKPKIGKRISWYDEGGGDNLPKRPSDLISIEYQTEGEVTAEDVLAAWPEDAPAEADERLLRVLFEALDAALDDAIEVGVESNESYGITDTDVPSVAAHKQNEYRTGFFTIARVTAEIWTRLSGKNAGLALPFVQRWSSSPLKFNQRLALFAAVDKAVPHDDAANVLLALPRGLLFLTNTTVEVFRLIRARWPELPSAKRAKIESRIVAGPPEDWFRSDADRMVDRCRFDLLGEMQRVGLALGDSSKSMLTSIQLKYPEWELRPPEQAGFHIWHEDGGWLTGNLQSLQDVPDELLIDEIKKAVDSADFTAGHNWETICQSEPQRALLGLQANARKGHWPEWAWNPFLWATEKFVDPDSIAIIAELLLIFPQESFTEIANAASWWLNKNAGAMTETSLWPLWDKIEAAPWKEAAGGTMRDALTDALNAPAGRLAEILIKKMAKGENGQEISDPIRERLNKLIAAPGRAGELARVRLAVEVSSLFEHAPNWTQDGIIPLFDWSSPDAPNVWSARRYSNYIGSPELFDLTKGPFLRLFGRREITEEELRVFAGWLTAIMIANRAKKANYPITELEARSALRSAGVRALSSVAHRLAIEMKAAKPEEKIAQWQNVVGPVFNSIWPLDAELQSSSSTFNLVQILCASGDAFQLAAEVITPFIQPEDPRRRTSVHSVSTADEIMYVSSPERMLDLVAAVVGNASDRSVFGLMEVLDRIRKHAPQLSGTRKFQKLVSLANTR